MRLSINWKTDKKAVCNVSTVTTLLAAMEACDKARINLAGRTVSRQRPVNTRSHFEVLGTNVFRFGRHEPVDLIDHGLGCLVASLI